MWDVAWVAAWIVSAAIFIFLARDFFRINSNYDEEQLLSSKEGVDELFTAQGPGH